MKLQIGNFSLYHKVFQHAVSIQHGFNKMIDFCNATRPGNHRNPLYVMVSIPSNAFPAALSVA